MHGCCSGGESAAVGVGARRWARKGVALVEWVLPVAALALVPKCPLCVAGYIALFTGVGVSFSTAATVRWAIVVMSVGALAFLLMRVAWRARGRAA